MITIKEKITLCIELKDGSTFPPKGKDSYSHKYDQYGILISLNKLEAVFKDDNDDWRFQERLFFPYTSIKMVAEQYEYQIEKQDVFNLIESKRSAGIKDAGIKEELERNGIKFSEEDLKTFLDVLNGDRKIFWDSDLEVWVTKKIHDDHLPKTSFFQETENLNLGNVEGCKREKR